MVLLYTIMLMVYFVYHIRRRSAPAQGLYARYTAFFLVDKRVLSYTISVRYVKKTSTASKGSSVRSQAYLGVTVHEKIHLGLDEPVDGVGLHSSDPRRPESWDQRRDTSGYFLEVCASNTD